jgi:hypothetical protein
LHNRFEASTPCFLAAQEAAPATPSSLVLTCSFSAAKEEDPSLGQLLVVEAEKAEERMRGKRERDEV